METKRKSILNYVFIPIIVLTVVFWAVFVIYTYKLTSPDYYEYTGDRNLAYLLGAATFLIIVLPTVMAELDIYMSLKYLTVCPSVKTGFRMNCNVLSCILSVVVVVFSTVFYIIDIAAPAEMLFELDFYAVPVVLWLWMFCCLFYRLLYLIIDVINNRVSVYYSTAPRASGSTVSLRGRFVLMSLVLLSVAAIIFASYAVFHYYHPTHYRYNDRFIIGNTYESIVERYGAFDKVTGTKGRYVAEPSRVGFLGTDLPLYYMVDFDENGIATGVYLVEGGVGG